MLNAPASRSLSGSRLVPDLGLACPAGVDGPQDQWHIKGVTGYAGQQLCPGLACQPSAQGLLRIGSAELCGGQLHRGNKHAAWSQDPADLCHLGKSCCASDAETGEAATSGSPLPQ